MSSPLQSRQSAFDTWPVQPQYFPPPRGYRTNPTFPDVITTRNFVIDNFIIVPVSRLGYNFLVMCLIYPSEYFARL